jgi:peptide/nickel transport system ATP-binding protein
VDRFGNVTSLLTVEGLRITTTLGRRRRTIVAGIDLEIARGETIGIVGESGSGKSLTARAILGLLQPGLEAEGSVRFDGEELLGRSERTLRRFRGRHISLLLQDPFTFLNPLMRVGRQITDTLPDRRGEAERRLTEVGIGDASVPRKYPFQLSGGMRQRVGIAAALASDPEILIADEPSTALDVTTQKDVLRLLRSVQQQRRMALVLITHDLRVAFSMCDRVYVLYAGSVLEVAAATDLEEAPMHPYSLALLASEPPLDRRLPRLAAVEGSVPSADDVAGGCPFAPRCPWAAAPCVAGPVSLAPVGKGRLSACVRIGEIADELQRERAVVRGSAAPAPASRRDADPLVRIEGLRKDFGATRAVDAVTLEIFERESIGLVGESGSGKSTLARCLVGLEDATAGTIVIGGIDATRHAGLSRAELRRVRSTVQIIFQDPYSSLNPARTVGATLHEALALSSTPSTVAELLERVHLPASYARRKPAALSGGERQRVAIARALAVRPKLIVCDEPVSALDVSVQAQMLNLFAEIRHELGIAYLFITHDLAVVRQIADHVYVMYRGSVVEAGQTAAVLDNPSHEYTRRLVESVPRSDPAWLAV